MLKELFFVVISFCDPSNYCAVNVSKQALVLPECEAFSEMVVDSGKHDEWLQSQADKVTAQSDVKPGPDGLAISVTGYCVPASKLPEYNLKAGQGL